MADLNGKSVVVTGAGQGLGCAYAKAAAAAGAKVVVNDVNAEAAERVAREICEAGGVAAAVPQDIRDPQAAEALIAHCVSRFGAVTGLVNNAALFAREPFETANVERLRALLDVNVVGLFNCARAAVGPMLAQGSGSIVNITSGAHAGQPGLSLYGATKGAVASFTYGWAAELGDRGVRVNAVSPMASTAMSDFNQRLPAPEANAPAVLYLLSDLSKGVNGQIVRINGRQLSLMSHPANRTPVLEREVWTLDSVAEAFEAVLSARQLPTNVVTYEIASVLA
jgi:NAD(P)-dependent dehydrogenase (short-subunit alcohol dehydrogenase family)